MTRVEIDPGYANSAASIVFLCTVILACPGREGQRQAAQPSDHLERPQCHALATIPIGRHHDVGFDRATAGADSRDHIEGGS